MDKHLHIVCLDVPYPVDYGGVFDLFYKIRSLHECGISIHLHCFEYGRGVQDELDKYCTEVKYYPRNKGHKGISRTLPYIVASRSDNSLLENLLTDDQPILLEGIHCTFLLNDERFANRKIILRLHNVEYMYYEQLFQSSVSPLKKMYYKIESKLLRQYEASIANKVLILAVAQNDVEIYKTEFGAKNIAYLPVFLPFEKVKAPEGVGCYCLFHGNLSVSENQKAVSWLLNNVFDEIKVPFVVAGKNPSNRVQRWSQQHSQTCLIINPSEDEMQDIISKAQINIIPSFNPTGIKLKLLNALYNGRHCVVNEAAVTGTGLEAACHVAGNKEAFKSIIAQLYHRPFTEEEIDLRKFLLEGVYDNIQNAQRLIQWIW